jgi:hypothetical protein
MFGIPMAELLSLVMQASQGQNHHHHRANENEAKKDFSEAQKLQQEGMKDLEKGNLRGARTDFAEAALFDEAGASALQNNNGFGSSDLGGMNLMSSLGSSMFPV